MKTRIPSTREVKIKTVKINAPVHFGDEDIPFDFPLRINAPDGDVWKSCVDMDTGQICDWPKSAGAQKLFLTVKDSGTYDLIGDRGELIATLQNYVPHGVIPGEYGDTIELTISADGIIENWPKKPDVSKFFQTDND